MNVRAISGEDHEDHGYDDERGGLERDHVGL
jgi:hypothetical protein